NGIPDECELADGSEFDCNQNGTLDSCDLVAGTSQDCNVNGIPDECEADCNGNGLDDTCDLVNGTSLDCNGNLEPDECDIAAGIELDCNLNGVPDSCDFASGFSLDCNANGIPDECDISSGFSADCDLDTVPDECQIAINPNLDLNGNGILDACECVVSSYCTSSPNSVGPGAVISYSGTAFVANNDLTLIASACPTSEFGIFFYGPGQISNPVGNGILCVSQFFRLAPILTNSAGTAALSMDLTSPPDPAGQIDAGETWNFQFWYRDPSAGGAGFNFTDALNITFCP
ncbi:MAG: hypothetical protein CMJ86_00230, partial [Planctomycetes bacterium]|nr:hypothetical protein [Planctomycetota bacterium]